MLVYLIQVPEQRMCLYHVVAWNALVALVVRAYCSMSLEVNATVVAVVE